MYGVRFRTNVDGGGDASLRQQMDRHFNECKLCKAVLDGTRNVAQLAGDKRAFQLPHDVSRRLYSRLEQHLQTRGKGLGETSHEIPVGITDDRVRLGSHLIYFWESDDDFLYPGLGQGEHCIVFGHDEAIQQVLEVLRSQGFNTDELIRNLELTVLRRHASAAATLSDIERNRHLSPPFPTSPPCHRQSAGLAGAEQQVT